MTAPQGKRATGRAGFSLLELLFSFSAFGIVMAALTGVEFATHSMSRSTREVALATSAVESVVESLRAEDFANVFARWQAPNNAFDVAGLDPAPDDADGFVGEIVFPGDGVQLLEDVDVPKLGMPRDLNLDGGNDAVDHSGDYRILPFMVRVRWRGAAGVQVVEVVGTLSER